jgi:DNA-binding response OmpR family regulator
MKKRILIVTDDKHLSEELQQKLEGNTDLLTVTAVSPDAGIELALQLKPHLMLLDSGLGGLSDDVVCQRLRRTWETSKIPLIVLLDAVSTGAEAYARSLGADDYLLKPVLSEELSRKVRIALRHSRNDGETKEVFDDGRLYIDFDAYLVRVNHQEPKLTLKEFSLLKFLIQNQGRVFSRAKLLDVVWGHQSSKTRTVDVHVRRIRKKLGPGSEEYIQTIISVGYLFKPQNEQSMSLSAQPGMSSI